MAYTPEEWVLVKVDGVFPHYRVFGSWRGGYLSSDSWRMNSGVISVNVEGDFYLFNGHSGSVYRCHKKAYGIRSPYNIGVLNSYEEKAEGKFKPFIDMPKIMEIDWL